jgi:pimeloyl-ACP methyl ester carboxylesterase
VVAEVARRHPAAVRGLVLVGPTADPRLSPRTGLVARWLRTAVREDPRRVPGMVRDYLTTRLSGFGRALRAARRHDLRATLRDSAVPVVVVRGPHDHLAPASWLDALAAVRPGITVVTTRDGAHMVPLTRPDELAGVCRAQFAG